MVDDIFTYVTRFLSYLTIRVFKMLHGVSATEATSISILRSDVLQLRVQGVYVAKSKYIKKEKKKKKKCFYKNI